MRLVSLIVPLYNEEGNVAKLYQELCSTADSLARPQLSTLSATLSASSSASHSVPPTGCDCEFIFVDDGSTDQTVPFLRQVSEGDSRVTIVLFRRNFGQTAAMAAGLDYARGEIVVTLDGDLQNDPAEVPRMIQKLDEGYDLVAGWRKNRQDKLLSRRLPSVLANRLISWSTNVRLHDYGCTLKAMRSEVAKNIQLYGEMHRFIPALAAEHGARIAEIPVNHRPRMHGTSKYGISRTFRVLLDLLTVKFFLGYSTRPLHLFGFLGMATGGLGSLMLLVLGYERMFMSVPLSNRPILLLATMLVLIGLQFICFGLLAEILVRTYHESQRKKIYSVREVLRSEETPFPRDTQQARRAVG